MDLQQMMRERQFKEIWDGHARQKGSDDDKDDTDAHNGEEHLDATISQDFSEGVAIKVDRQLSLLRGKKIQLAIPNYSLNDSAGHITAKPQIVNPQTDNPQVDHHYLQDYQTQLMLLKNFEEKKMHLKARQKQDAQEKLVDSPADTPTARHIEDNPQNNAPRKRKRSFSEVVFAQEDQSELDSMRQATTEYGKLSRQRALDRALNAPQDEQSPSHSILLYSVKGEDDDCWKYHRVSTFLDHPKASSVPDPEASDRYHLDGQDPVLDLKTFMKNDSDDIAFVVIRTIECSNEAVLLQQAGHSLGYDEAIYAKSALVKGALRCVATCYFNPVKTVATSTSYLRNASEPSAFDYDRSRIFPAKSFFYHHRLALKTYSLSHASSRPHVDALLQYINSRYGDSYARTDRLMSNGFITQESIMLLFKPNDLILCGIHGKPSVFVLQDWPAINSDNSVSLSCWSLLSNGTRFTRNAANISIPPLKKPEVKIRDLVALPLAFADPAQRSAILQRGKKIWAMRSTTHVSYRGLNVKGDQYWPGSRFMIDPITHRKMHPESPAFSRSSIEVMLPYDTMPAALNNDQEPSELCLLLLPPDLHAFDLNEKQWHHLFVDNVEEVKWNKKAYERLVLPEKTKELVQALVTVRTSQRRTKYGLGVSGKRTDITGGKGNGLIMLLHGGPGTGKTLTGESVAELAELPLYRVTCGDIGTNAADVEKYLRTVLHLGRLWNCVLLLDEADVFLEERSNSDLARNALVSVFLRVLEYYDGILILTSNRIGMFDEAFKSRIQVALHYENLARPARKRIWENFIEMLEEDEENVDFHEMRSRVDELAGHELNGRQIRNVLTTARQLAVYRNERLEWQHLQQSLGVSSKFNDYLKRMQGHTDDEKQRDLGLRY